MKTREEIIAEIREISRLPVEKGSEDIFKNALNRALSVIDQQWSENHTLKECLKNQMQCVAELKFFDNEKAKLIGELEEKLEIATHAFSDIYRCENLPPFAKATAKEAFEILNQTKTNNDK